MRQALQYNIYIYVYMKRIFEYSFCTIEDVFFSCRILHFTHPFASTDAALGETVYWPLLHEKEK